MYRNVYIEYSTVIKLMKDVYLLIESRIFQVMGQLLKDTKYYHTMLEMFFSHFAFTLRA